jgi:hypothetical protein
MIWWKLRKENATSSVVDHDDLDEPLTRDDYEYKLANVEVQHDDE